MRLNVFLLFIAFAIGQGSLFLSQTILVVDGHLEFVGIFGLNYTFMVLAFLVVDWGGTIRLARSELEIQSRFDANCFYWAYCWVRCGVAMAVAGAALIAGGVVGDQFSLGYIAAAVPGLVIWAFNPTGILDGLHRSGWAGIANVLPILTSAAILPMALDDSPETAGMWLGGAYAAGSIAAVVVQHLMIRRLGRNLSFCRPARSASGHSPVRVVLWHGVMILLTQLPGQIFYRAQLAICGALLGPAAMGVIVYAKQIANGAAQAIQFIRRAEFPRLVETLQSGPQLGTAMKVQWTGVGFALMLGFAFGGGGLWLWAMNVGNFAEPASVVASFAPVVVSGAIFGALNQIFVGMKNFRTAAACGNMMILIGTLLSMLLVGQFGLFGLAIAEFLMHILGIVGLLAAWKYQKSADAKWAAGQDRA